MSVIFQIVGIAYISVTVYAALQVSNDHDMEWRGRMLAAGFAGIGALTIGYTIGMIVDGFM